MNIINVNVRLMHVTYTGESCGNMTGTAMPGVERSPPRPPDTLVNLSPAKADWPQENKPHKRLQSPTKSYQSCTSTCRICHEDDLMEALISPCLCTGTVALLHRNCLEKWLSTSNTEECEICRFNFKIKRHRRTFKEWLRSGEEITGPNGLFGDIWCIIFLTPVCFVSVYSCAVTGFSYFRRAQWEGIGLVVISLTLLVGYIFWLYITIKFHLRCLKTWRDSNPLIQLATTPSQPPTP